MKKYFWAGFFVGVVYVALLPLIESEGLGMLIELIIQPGGFIVGGVLQYFFREILSNQAVYWGLVALVQGMFIGLVFVGVARLFKRRV